MHTIFILISQPLTYHLALPLKETSGSGGGGVVFISQPRMRLEEGGEKYCLPPSPCPSLHRHGETPDLAAGEGAFMSGCS